MARKKGRVPSPSPSPPPPTPTQEESSSDDDEEEEEEAAPATQKAPPNPRPPSTAAADADSSDGGEEESSDSEADANAYQVREVARSPGKPSESDADEEDDTSSDSPEPVQKKAAARKPKAESGKKRQAAESIPSGGKAKKAKADVDKAAPLSGKAAPSEPNASSKGKKRKEKAGVPDQSPSKPALRRWTTEDEIKILEALVSHVKTNGTQPSPGDLIAAIGDSLERKNCSKTEMYEKVRNLRQRHEKAASTGILPANEDDLRKFKLSEAVWGEGAKEVAAAPVSQNDAASSKSKKGQTKKEKKGGKAKEATGTVNENVGTLTQSDKGQATKEKGRLSKKAATADTPDKGKKRGNHKEDLEEDINTGTTKETTNAATQNGGTLVRNKSGKSDKEEKDGDADAGSLGPKEGTSVTQNDDNLAETHEEKMDIDPNVKKMRRGFHELQNLYPNLASYVESIQAQHPCGETLKRAFEFIADEKACALESKIKKQRVVEMKTEMRRADTKKEVTNLFIGLMD